MWLWCDNLNGCGCCGWRGDGLLVMVVGMLVHLMRVVVVVIVVVVRVYMRMAMGFVVMSMIMVMIMSVEVIMSVRVWMGGVGCLDRRWRN